MLLNPSFAPLRELPLELFTNQGQHEAPQTPGPCRRDFVGGGGGVIPYVTHVSFI